MPEKFTFTANTGSLGYRLFDRQDPRICYGVVWRSHGSKSKWVAEYPGSRPGNGGGIPGFATRLMVAWFLYRYRKPQPSGRA